MNRDFIAYKKYINNTDDISILNSEIKVLSRIILSNCDNDNYELLDYIIICTDRILKILKKDY